MNFVVIEGLDGSGKSTQISLLREYLESNNIRHKYLHFPRTDTPVYGELIARFLRGDSGDINAVDPYMVALLYAGDRNDAKHLINNWIKDGYFVLVDRYVNSNIAFQCAKLSSDIEKVKLKNWIIKLEYEYNQLPVPDINIFLDVPFEFTEHQLLKDRKGADRDYLDGKADIHEADLIFQRKVREVYLSLDKLNDKNLILNCYGKENNMLSPKMIFNSIIEVIK